MKNQENSPPTSTKFWCFFAPLLIVEITVAICWGFKTWWPQAYGFATMFTLFGTLLVPFTLGLFYLIMATGKSTTPEKVVGRYGFAGSVLAFISGVTLFILLTSNPKFLASGLFW